MILKKEIGKVVKSGKVIIKAELGHQSFRKDDNGYFSISGEEWYMNGRGISSCGQIDMHLTVDSFRQLNITKEQLKRLLEIWKEWHLQPIENVPEEIIEEIKLIME